MGQRQDKGEEDKQDARDAESRRVILFRRTTDCSRITVKVGTVERGNGE